MYETIDDNAAEDAEQPQAEGGRRLSISAVILAGLCLLALAAIYTAYRPKDVHEDIASREAEQAAYMAAITEPSAALRRARLLDFLQVYPGSPRQQATQTQLQVLNLQEQQDWAVLSDIIFDTRIENPEKLAARERYKSQWDITLMGGREADMARMNAHLELDIETLPNRDLPVDTSEFSGKDTNTVMAGGAPSPQGTYIQPRSPSVSYKAPQPAVTSAITPARIRRNVSPRYPRRALEAGEEAVVVLRLYVNDRGRVDRAELASVRANRFEKDFIRAAKRAARRTRYHPREVGGIAAAAPGIEKRYVFKISE